MVRALSMPRPAYRAAHSPAGPAPTMMTSYSRLASSVIGSEFQARGIALSRKGARELRAKVHGIELDFGTLRPGQLRECRRSNHDGAMAGSPCPVQPRRRGLGPPPPHPGLGFLPYRKPHR